MAQKLKIAAASLNIRLHPHSSTHYADWLALIFSRRIIAHVHDDRYGMISTLDRSELSKGSLSGVITTFTKFEDGGTWFNAEQLTEATDDQKSEITIPRNLYPNAAAFYFYFDLETHKLHFQTYSRGKRLTPSSAQRMFGGLSRDQIVIGRFGEAKINVVQDKASLDRLFGIEKISEIEITIVKPNPDIFDDDFEAKIEAHLAETHSRQIAISYKAEAGQSINATDEIRQISGIALENGSVKVSGRDDKGAVVLKSDSFPEEKHDRFDPDGQTEQSAFMALLPIRRRRKS